MPRGHAMNKRNTLVLMLASLALTIFAAPDETRMFKNWQACFRFMAEDNDNALPSDEATLFKLAAESSMEWFWLEEGTNRIVIAIKLDFLKGPYSAIRGAQGNGLYYLLVPVGDGYQFVGKMEGNRFAWSTLNGKARFTAAWHVSASEWYENVYDWDGKMFRQTGRVLRQRKGGGS